MDDSLEEPVMIDDNVLITADDTDKNHRLDNNSFSCISSSSPSNVGNTTTTSRMCNDEPGKYPSLSVNRVTPQVVRLPRRKVQSITPTKGNKPEIQKVTSFSGHYMNMGFFHLPLFAKPWTDKESEKLLKAKCKKSDTSWEDIAQDFPGRSASECLRHWFSLKEVRGSLKIAQPVDTQKHGNELPTKALKNRSSVACLHRGPNQLKLNLPGRSDDKCENLNEENDSLCHPKQNITIGSNDVASGLVEQNVAVSRQNAVEHDKGIKWEEQPADVRMKSSYWTKEEEQIIKRMKTNNPSSSWAEIAKAVNRSSAACNLRWNGKLKHNLPGRSDEKKCENLHEENDSLRRPKQNITIDSKDAERDLIVSCQSAVEHDKGITREEQPADVRIKKMHYWTKEEEEIIMRMKTNNPSSSWAEIAKVLKNRSSKACNLRWNGKLKHNLPRRSDDKCEVLVDLKACTTLSFEEVENDLFEQNVVLCQNAVEESVPLPTEKDEVIAKEAQPFDVRENDHGVRWTKEEDEIMIRMKTDNPPSSWVEIAKVLKKRTSIACERRWYYKLKNCVPAMNNDKCKNLTESGIDKLRHPKDNNSVISLKLSAKQMSEQDMVSSDEGRNKKSCNNILSFEKNEKASSFTDIIKKKCYSSYLGVHDTNDDFPIANSARDVRAFSTTTLEKSTIKGECSSLSEYKMMKMLERCASLEKMLGNLQKEKEETERSNADLKCQIENLDQTLKCETHRANTLENQFKELSKEYTRSLSEIYRRSKHEIDKLTLEVRSRKSSRKVLFDHESCMLDTVDTVPHKRRKGEVSLLKTNTTAEKHLKPSHGEKQSLMVKTEKFYF